MSEHTTLWQKIEAWWHLLWHHAQAGTLPNAPVAGGVPVTIPPVGGTVTPPAPPIPVPAPVATAPEPLPGLPAGVTYADATNGLFKIDAADAVYPGQLYCVRPDLAGIPAGTQAYATANWNTSSAKVADQGLGLHVRVNTMVPAKDADGSNGWANSNPLVWIDHAWSIGAEFDTWDKAVAQAVVIANRLAHASTGGGSGFSPGH